MAEAWFRILHAGPHASWQDAGRTGFLRFGVPASGPMDRGAFATAQALVGNPPGAAAIEVPPGGVEIECTQGAAAFAVAGGGFILTHAGQSRAAWGRGRLRAGDRLSLRRGPWGSWCILAFAGTVDLPPWLGSRATHAPSGLGGGRIAAGQEFRLDTPAAPQGPDWVPVPCPVWARPRRILHAVPGPQDRFFPPEVLADFFGSPFRLTDAYDRMGLRLSGPALRPEGALSIPSEPILRGSVQVNGAGVATVLLADHQTTGGYPKIATVIDADLDGLVQCRPRDRVIFRAIPPDQALHLGRQRARRIAAFLDRLRAGLSGA